MEELMKLWPMMEVEEMTGQWRAITELSKRRKKEKVRREGRTRVRLEEEDEQ